MGIASLAIPQLIVEVNGQPLSAVTTGLGELRIQQRLSLPSLCELTFCDLDAKFGTDLRFSPGDKLRVALRNDPDALFLGEVTALEHVYQATRGPELRVRAYDLLHRLRKHQPVRALVEVGLAELATELVADLGITVQAPRTDLLWRRLIQHNQSNLDLLSELVESCGLYFVLRENVLHLLSLEGTGDAIPLALGKSLFEARIEVNGDASCRSVAAAGWNPLTVAGHKGTAQRARVGRKIAAEVPPDRVNGAHERTLAGQAVLDDRQAEALAQAELDRRIGREVVLWGVADGNPRLRPGTPVDLSGVAADLRGRYILTEVTHLVDREKGFVSEISTAPAPPAMRPKGTLMTLGVVTRVNDPERLGRVQVSLPAYDNVETDWMGVLTMGVGAGKGVVMLPDMGDEVLVLCAKEDPAHGVVLGGLCGKGPPDSGVEGDTVKRFAWLTPGGQLVRMDDTKKSLRLENADGSYLEITPKVLSLHSEAKIEIDAPGQTILIRGKAINFEEA
ncbi:MAG TPA: phage baseplate assembly protein V [Terrimicrobiaceae bacterium]